MRIFKNILEIFFPNHCISCSKIIAKEALFCSICWPKLQFITEPKCKICSYPFGNKNNQTTSELLCSRCLSKKPSFDKVITIFRYNDIVKKIIGDLKYRDQTFIAKKLAKLLSNKIKLELDNADIITIVPPHKKRLSKRKFNQAALLAKAVIYKKSPILYLDLLLRKKNSESQVKLTKKQREKNLQNIFIVKEKYRNLISGKKILIIDDVTTTGATIENCAKVLKKFGAKEVVITTIAKTILNDPNLFT